MLKSIRGMPDILPAEMPMWHHLETTFRSVANQYGFDEIRMPIVEKTQLFTGSIGEVTDIVSREMYTFVDKNNDYLSLRPEGTAGCVRALIQHNIAHQTPQRLWYYGQMFRRERPQKGRQRQFNQFGVELYGCEKAQADIEVILLSSQLWSRLGLSDLVLEINSLGTPTERSAYRSALQDYLREHFEDLDKDSQNRLEQNPLRVLDSKNPDMRSIIKNAPLITDFLEDESREHFSKICEALDAAKINYIVNPQLVRGLDYYGRTVFEWVTNKLGAQATVCGGGRYDTLVETQGGKPTAAVGFAMGAERIVELLKMKSDIVPSHADLYFISTSEQEHKYATKLAEKLRSELPYLRIVQDITGGKFKTQFKRADRNLSRFAVIIGESELENQQVTIKDMQNSTDWQQQTINEDELFNFIKQYIPLKQGMNGEHTC